MTRGLWLIVLEVTIINVGITFNPDYRFLGFLQVIWVIGVSMIVLAALIYLPKSVIAAFGLLMIALHNLLDGIRVVGFRGPTSPMPSPKRIPTAATTTAPLAPNRSRPCIAPSGTPRQSVNST